MNTTLKIRLRNRLLGTFGLGLVATLLLASPALADPGRGRGVPPFERRGHDDRYDRDEHRARSHGVGHAGHAARFLVPQRIHRHDRVAYRGYYVRGVYHPLHRHVHAVYRFPVYTSRGVVYRDYPYCNGVLDRGGVSGFFTLSGRQFRIAIGF